MLTYLSELCADGSLQGTKLVAHIFSFSTFLLPKTASLIYYANKW